MAARAAVTPNMALAVPSNGRLVRALMAAKMTGSGNDFMGGGNKAAIIAGLLRVRYGPGGVGRTAHGGGDLSSLPQRGTVRPVKRILVIDDDAKLRGQCAELLRLEGYEVAEARNGRDGVE